MQRMKQILGVFLFAAFVLVGCQKEAIYNADPETESINALEATRQMSKAEKQAKIDEFMARFPQRTMDANSSKLADRLHQHPEFAQFIKNKLALEEEVVCDDYTSISQWLDGELEDWDIMALIYYIFGWYNDYPLYHALLYENNSKNQYFGKDGEYTKISTKTFRELNRFWDINSSGIVLAGAHGNVFMDREKLIQLEMAVYGESYESAAEYADFIIEIFTDIEAYRQGEHPIFTFNAFAVDGPWEFEGNFIPAKIILGDGILEGFAAIGFGDVAPQAILAHEYAHQIQFQLNAFGDEISPESTRRTEMMADAQAAYFLHHARGATMQWKRVKQFLQVFYNIGDCGFDNDNHHGTPEQRMRAAEWGYRVAMEAQKQGHIMSAADFIALFDEALPSLL